MLDAKRNGHRFRVLSRSKTNYVSAVHARVSSSCRKNPVACLRDADAGISFESGHAEVVESRIASLRRVPLSAPNAPTAVVVVQCDDNRTTIDRRAR
jgi:hypothetical protein